MQLESLEGRRLLAADAAAPLAFTAAAPHAVVVIDSTLVASIPQEEFAGSLVVSIDDSRDAIDQITTALAGLTDVDTLRVISHGSDGSLWFGAQAIGAATLAARSADISGWSRSLTADADILLYGCSIASTLDGRLFVEQLGSLTQADVAASTNPTGAGGDETLEFQTGDVSAGMLADAAAYDRSAVSLDVNTRNSEITSWTNNQNGTVTVTMKYDISGLFYYAGGYTSPNGYVYMYLNGKQVARQAVTIDTTFTEYGSSGLGSVTRGSKNLRFTATFPISPGDNEISVSPREGFPTQWSDPYPKILTIEAPYYLGMPSTYTVPAGQTMYVVSNAFGTPTINYSASNLPRGVSIDSRGVILGNPASGTAGTYNVVLQASNGFGTATWPITVTVTNQAPGFATTTPATVSGATEDTPFTITYAALAAAFGYDCSDPNGDPLSFRIESLLGGTLTKNGSPVTAGTTSIAAGETLVWTPPASANGTLTAFSVKAYDGVLYSATAKTVQVAVAAVNDPPTFTQFSGPVSTGNEDSAIAISFADLVARGNEADIDSTINAFVVKAVTTGSLRIGATEATAIPWNATTNKLVTSSLNAYWTPDANANGPQSAFTVVARDDGGLESAAPIQAVVTVNPVNDGPILTSVAIISGAAGSDPLEISYAALATAANEADVDGDALAFRLEAVSTGTVEKWTGSAWAAVVPGTTLVGAGDKIRWTPVAGSSGLRNAFTVKAWDGQIASATAVQVRIDGDRWRVLPWTDAASTGVAPTYRYTHAYSFGAAGSFAVGGVTFTGVAGGNPSVAGSLDTTGFAGVATNDANNLADASRSLANDAVTTSAATSTVTLHGLIPGGRYVLSLFTVGLESGTRPATLSSAMGQITVNENAYGDNNGVRVDYPYLADASGSVTVTLSVPGAAFSLYGLANRESAPAIRLDAPTSLTYDGAPKQFQAGLQGFATASNSPFVSAGTLHSVVLNADGTVSAFGANSYGQTDVPAALTDVVAVSAGDYHTLALKSDGTVVAWGMSSSGQSTVPAGLANVVSISAGGSHSLVLKSDGTVVAWGSNTSGQCNVPAGLTGVVAISAGSNHSLALKSDGTVVAWGYYWYDYATPPAGLADVVAISAGSMHSLALKSDGTVVAWGNNASSQSSVPAGLRGVVAISAGSGHSLALKSDGTIVAWGDRGLTAIPAGLSGVVAIDAGSMHSVALKSDGTVIGWGTSTISMQPAAVGIPGRLLSLAGSSVSFSYQGRNATTYAASATPPTNAGDYTVTANGTVSGNAWSLSRDFTIAKGTPSISYYSRVNTIPYGTPLSADQVGSFAARGMVGNLAQTLPGTYVYSPAVGAVLPLGQQTLQVTFLPTDSANFNPAVATGTITVTRAAVSAASITLTPPGSLTYTGTAKAYTASATGVAGFTCSYSGRAGTSYGPSSVAPTYAGSYTVTATVNDPNYTGTKSLDFTIAKAVPTITTSPTASTLTFGQTLAAATLSGGVTSVPGSFAFGYSGAAPSAGTWSYDVVFTPADTVNYTTATGTVSVTVSPIAIAAGAFTFSTPSSLVYNGSPKFYSATAAGPWGTLSGMNYSYTGIGGTTYGPSATAPTSAGSYAVTATLSGSNFAGSATQTFTITKATPAITWGTPADIAYGTTLSATQLNASAAVAGSFVYTPAAGTLLAAGARTLQTVFTPTDTTNYNAVTAAVPLQVTTTSLPISLVPPPLLYDGTAKPFVVSQMAYISSGWDHSLALKTDGTVTAWGSNTFANGSPHNAAVVPAGLSGVVQVSAGAYHSVAVKSNGTLVTWGSNGQYQSTGAVLNLPYTGPGWTAITQRDVITSATAAAAGGMLTVVLRADGTVTVLGDSTYTSAVNVPAGLSGVTAVAAGDRHAVALKSDGTVVAWGNNDSGQTDVPTGLSGVIAIAAGGNHTLALKSDGTVVAWGNNSTGQTTVPAGLSGVVAIAAGYSKSYALKTDGTVIGWGLYPGSGGVQCVAPGSGVVAFSSDANGNLQLLRSDGTVKDVSGNVLATGIGFPAYSVSYAGRSGTTYAASSSPPTNAGSYTLTVTSTDPNYSGGKTIDFTIAEATPTITTLPQASILAEGQALSAAVLDGGVASVPGTFAFSSPAFVPSAGTTTQEITFTPADTVNYNAVTRTVTVLSQGTNAATPAILSLPTAAPITFGQRLEASVLSGGSASVPGTFVYTSRLTVANPGTARQSATFIPTDIASYATVTMFVPLTVYDGINSPLNIPLVPPPSLTYDGAQKAFSVSRGPLISSFRDHVLIVNTDGTVTAFGDNFLGGCNVPAGLTGVVAVSAGDSISLALKSDGTVVEWGGDAGSGPLYGRPPAGLTNVVAISRTLHGLALKSDGTVVAWGDNTYGQRNVPAGLTNVVAIAGNQYTSFALKSDGTVVSWGGQSNIPVGLSGVIAIDACPYGGVVALKSDGTVVTWDFGSPPDGLSGVVAVAAGSNHMAALKSDGTVVAWGANTVFTASGNTTNLVPYELTGVVAISAGSNRTFALKADGSVVWWGQGSTNFGLYRVNGELYRTPTGGYVDLRKGDAIAGVSAGFAYTATYAGREGTVYASSATPPTEPGDYSVSVVGTGSAFTTPKTYAFSIAKATPSITVTPAAAGISYGQSLASAILSGGSASVAGTFAFAAPATAPSFGTNSQSVVFTPTDTSRYLPVTLSVPVAVARATPALVTLPTATTITYGQSLASAILANGQASVAGVFAFTDSGTTPAAGSSSQGITFTPADTANYDPFTTTVSLFVAQATPTITTPPSATSILYGQTLADSVLSGGVASVPGTFAFADTSLAPASGTANEDVIFTPTDSANYAPVTLAVAVHATSFAPADDAGSAGEASGTVNDTAGFDAVGNVLDNETNYDGSDLAVTSITGSLGAGTIGTPLAGTYGSLTILADGSYAYMVDNANAAVQALAVGATLADSFTYGVDSATDTASATLRITIFGGNDAPAFASVGTGPLKQGVEDTETAITFAEILQASNAADVDGTVVAFVVTSVASGTLRIGADAESASPWDADTNALVDATHIAYWTPDADANDTLAAFSVIARDDGGLDSATPVAIRIGIDPVNDAPSLASVTIAYEDTPAADRFAAATGTLAPTDVDSTAFTFGITGVTPVDDVFTQVGVYGTLAVNRLSGEYAFTPNDAAINAATGPVSEVFSVFVSDGAPADALGTALFTVNVTGTNERPTLTGFGPALTQGTEGTQKEVLFSELLARSDAADMDGTIDAFVVTAVVSGQLWIGTSAETAAPWDASSNAVITPSLNGYWTPDIDANGPLDAFAVIALDNDGNTSATAVTYQIPVAAVNDGPSLTTFALAAGAVNEDTEVELTFAAIAAVGDQSDPDGTATAFVVKSVPSGTLRIGADAASAAAWNADTNAVIDAGLNAYWTPAANASGSFVALTAVARDDGGLESPLAVGVSVTVFAVNDQPTDIGLSAASVAENAAVGTVVGTLSTTDVDPSDVFTYTLVSGEGGDDNASFAIDGSTLKTAATFSYEAKNSYTVRVRTTDDGGLFREKAFTITVTNVNEGPADIALSPTSVAENAPAGTAVGTLSTTDVDAGDTFTYTLVSGTGSADNTSFAIDGSTLKTAASFNFETKGSYTVRIRTTDAGGLFTEKAFTITVTNVNEGPTDIALSATGAAENSPAGTAVGTLSTTDVDAGDTFTYTLVPGTGSADNASFAINGTTLKTTASFNFEVKNSYAVRVRTTDAGGLFTEKAFTITVTDVVEPAVAPTVVIPAVFTVVEDTPTGLRFTGTPFADADSPANKTMTVTLAVTAGAITATTGGGVTVAGTATARTFAGTVANLNAYFTASPERITYTPAANSTASRTLTATIAEANGTRILSSSTSGTIAITAVNDAPIVSAPASFTVTEDVKGNLLWPATSTPFADVDSPSLTVTLSVADGTISAAGTATVTVGGTATARTFTGSPAGLNAYFKTLGRIGYTTALDNTVARTLTTTVSDGALSASTFTRIAITPVNDAPTINAAAVLGGGKIATPYEITYDTLRAALNVADVEKASPSLVIQSVNVGTLQRWTGAAWVNVSTAATATVAQRTLSAGGKIRWLPPAGVSGDRAAFKVRASDGALSSATTAQVTINLAP